MLLLLLLGDLLYMCTHALPHIIKHKYKHPKISKCVQAAAVPLMTRLKCTHAHTHKHTHTSTRTESLVHTIPLVVHTAVVHHDACISRGSLSVVRPLLVTGTAMCMLILHVRLLTQPFTHTYTHSCVYAFAYSYAYAFHRWRTSCATPPLITWC